MSEENQHKKSKSLWPENHDDSYIINIDNEGTVKRPRNSSATINKTYYKNYLSNDLSQSEDN